MVAEQPCVLLLSDSADHSPLPRMLQLQDVDVDVVSSGAEAGRSLKTKHYAVLMLDLIMIEPGSLDFLKMRSAEAGNASLPIVMLLTAASNEALAQLDPDLVHVVVRKPTDLAELSEIVHDCTLKVAERRSLTE